MTQTQIKMATLYERLSGMGFPEKFVREKALPDWWDEEFEATPGAIVEAAAYVSRRFNLDIVSLLQSEVPVFKPSCNAKFKTKQGTESQYLKVAQCMATRVAQMVAYACVPEYKPLPNSAEQVRHYILETYKIVTLEALLEFCWNYGIPVVHFDDFPTFKRVHKFDGLVGYFYNRPVIVISLKHSSPARLLFILAHELGHLIKGHVQDNAIVDEEIEPESVDGEELEANEFAVELLLGKPDMGYYTPRILTGEQLANYAQRISSRDRVDPGVVVLNIAWSKANITITRKEQGIIWATAFKALKIIEGNTDAQRQINTYVQKYVDLDRLDGDSQDYLKLVIAG